MAYPNKDRYTPNHGTAGSSNWQEGDYVTATNMNHIEDGIDQALRNAEDYTDGALATVSTLTGTSAPSTSTEGTVGQRYLNTFTKDLYECIGINNNQYIWKLVYKWSTTYNKYYLVDADGHEISKKDLCLVEVWCYAADEQVENDGWFKGTFMYELEPDSEGMYTYTLNNLRYRLARCPICVYYDFSGGGDGGPWISSGILQYDDKSESFFIVSGGIPYFIATATTEYLHIYVYGPGQY